MATLKEKEKNIHKQYQMLHTTFTKSQRTDKEDTPSCC